MAERAGDIRNFFPKLTKANKKNDKLCDNTKLKSSPTNRGNKRKFKEISDHEMEKKEMQNTNNKKQKIIGKPLDENNNTTNTVSPFQPPLAIKSKEIKTPRNDSSSTDIDLTGNDIDDSMNNEQSLNNMNNIPKEILMLHKINEFIDSYSEDKYIYSKQTERLQFESMDQYNIIKIKLLQKTTSDYSTLIHLLQHIHKSFYKIIVFHGWFQKIKISSKTNKEYHSKPKALYEFQNILNQRIKQYSYKLCDDLIDYDITDFDDDRFPIYKESVKSEILSKIFYDLKNEDVADDGYIEKVIADLERQFNLKRNTLQYVSHKTLIKQYLDECLQNEKIQKTIKMEQIKQENEEKERESWKVFEDYEVFMIKKTNGTTRFYTITMQKHIGRELYKVILYWGETMWSGTYKVTMFNEKKKATAKYKKKKKDCICGGSFYGSSHGGGYQTFDIEEYRKNNRIVINKQKNVYGLF